MREEAVGRRDGGVEDEDRGEPPRLELSPDARQFQAELLASLATLTGGVAHELNNPLAFVAMNLTAIARCVASLAEGASPAQAAPLGELGRLVAETSDGVDRVVSTVRELKLFARPAGAPEPIDVRALLDATLNLLSSELRRRGRLRRDYGDLPTIHGETAALAQLLLGLFAQVVRALPERAPGHEVWVTARAHGGGVEIVAGDDGPGLSPEALAALFDPGGAPAASRPAGRSPARWAAGSRSPASPARGRATRSSCRATSRCRAPPSPTTRRGRARACWSSMTSRTWCAR